MAIFELYHQRKHKAARAGEPEVYVYDQLPAGVRTQIAQIARDAIGRYSTYENGPHNNFTWQQIRKILCRELGRDNLFLAHTPDEEVLQFFSSCGVVDVCLSVTELICYAIETMMPGRAGTGATQKPEAALDEINYRLRQAGVGYQYESGQIIRVDSQLLHQEVVKPALSLLADKRFAGAQEEYLTAHKHYRDGNHKDAVNWANKAFESAMKAACDIRGWPYDKNARASDLAKVLQANGLWPDYLDGSFEQLIATLKSGLPEVRNKAGAHGQGAQPKATPAYVAAYALHLAAAKIVLIGEAALSKR